MKGNTVLTPDEKEAIFLELQKDRMRELGRKSFQKQRNSRDWKAFSAAGVAARRTKKEHGPVA